MFRIRGDRIVAAADGAGYVGVVDLRTAVDTLSVFV